MSDMADDSSTVDIWVVTVCLNDVLGLTRTLWSIAGQEGVRLGVVIADGGSSDGSLEMANAFAEFWPATFVLPGPDSGIYHGMNRGLAATPGDPFVWFLNAGDFFTDGRAVCRVLDSRTTSTVWLGGPIATVRPSGAVDGITAVPCVGLSEQDVLPAQPSMMTRKSVISNCGGFREDLRLAADSLLVQQLADTHHLTVYSEPAVYFGLGGRSSSNIALTLSELRAGASSPASFSAKWYRERQVIAKTRLRHMLHAMEMKLPPSLAAGPLNHRRLAKLEYVAHWPHPQVRHGSIQCCHENAVRFASRLIEHST